MRCMNNCPQRAIETAHGMATLMVILVSAVNTWIFMILIETLHIDPVVWWWKICSQFVNIAVMISLAVLIYFVIHYLMGFRPISYLVRFTSLTTYPFWRRYRYHREKKDTGGAIKNSAIE